jgi:hypothetical protein
MLVMVRVPFALLGTAATRLEACLHDRACELRRELRLPAQDLPRCEADVAAVLAQGDRTKHRQDIWVSAGGIAAGGAALRAVEARLDARHQRNGIDVNRPWIRLQHLPSVAHCGPLVPGRLMLLRAVRLSASGSVVAGEPLADDLHVPPALLEMRRMR